MFADIAVEVLFFAGHVDLCSGLAAPKTHIYWPVLFDDMDINLFS